MWQFWAFGRGDTFTKNPKLFGWWIGMKVRIALTVFLKVNAKIFFFYYYQCKEVEKLTDFRTFELVVFKKA